MEYRWITWSELIYQADLKTLISLNKPQLQALKQYIQEQAVQIPDLRIEVKDYSVALHFREHPQLEDRVHAFALECLNQFSDFELKAGKYVLNWCPKVQIKVQRFNRLFSNTISLIIIPCLSAMT